MASGELAPSYGASAWGEGRYGQLGDGNNNASKLPVSVTGLSEVTAVAGGSSFALALLSNGTVMAWGHNAVGELGDGSTTESTVPVTVSGLSGVTAIAAGRTDGYALLSNGTVMAWGENDVGELGTGSMTGPETCEEGYLACSTRPVAVRGLTGVTSIAGGEGFALALLSNGTVVAWGQGERGKLGDGKLSNSALPVAVQGLTGVTAIAAGYDGMALLGDGSVRDWGFNAGGLLGTGSMTGPESCGGEACSTVPVAVSGLSDVSAIASGGAHNLALLGNGTVRAWGYNAEGMLGNGTEANSDLPTEVVGLSEATAIAAGSYHSMALLSNGTVKSWGWDAEWELGNAEAEGKSAVPVPVSYLSGVQSIAAGAYDGFAVGPASTPVPTVTEVEPNHGPPSGGTTVTVTGTNFTGATAVHFGSTAAKSFAVNSATSITAVSPAGAGAVDVTVTTPEGTSPTTVHDWFVYGPPTVTKVEPGSGGLSGGASVTITGTNLEAATEVTFGSTPASYYHVNSNSSITAISPSGQGTVDVTVSTYAGTSATSAADRFTYARTACEEEVQNAVPVVTGVTPASGPEAGGTTVRVTGERFYQVQGCVVEPSVKRVLFGGREASSVRVESEGALTAVAPPGSGTVDVTVETNAASQTSAADRYNYIHTVPPQVSGITPSAGSPAGGPPSRSPEVASAAFQPCTSGRPPPPATRSALKRR